MVLSNCCVQEQRNSSNNNNTDNNINIHAFDIGSPLDSNFDFTAEEDINNVFQTDVIDSQNREQYKQNNNNNSEQVFVIRENSNLQIVDASPIDELCTDNDLIQMLQSTARESIKEGSPNMQSSNTTESNFKLTTNSKIDAEDAQHVLEHDQFLDDLFSPLESDQKVDAYLQFNDLKQVPQMEDLEKFLFSPKAADLIPQNFNLHQTSSVQVNQNQKQIFALKQQQYQQNQLNFQQQQQLQLKQMAPPELVPVMDQEPACKKQKQTNNQNLPAYQNLKEVRGALTSTLNALDGNSRQNLEYDQNFFRRSSSYPFQNHNLNPGLGFNGFIQSNLNENMNNRSLHGRGSHMEPQISPFRQFIPTPNYARVKNPYMLQNQQLQNKIDYINGIPYMHDAEGGQFFVDPQTGRRMSPGPAYFKRQREEHGPNLQNIFQRFGSNGRQFGAPTPTPTTMGGYPFRQPHLQPRHSSYSLLESRQFDEGFLGGGMMGGKGSGLVKEGVLDQIRSSSVSQQQQQWLKMEQNMHLQRQAALHQQQKQQQQQHQHQQRNGQETQTMQQATAATNDVSVSIAQKVVSEATERGLDGRRSSGFTIESQFQRQQVSGRVSQQVQGVSREPWSVHFDAHVKDQNGHQHFLGGYASQSEAARAHDVGQLYFHPESTATNYPAADYASVEELRRLGPSDYVLEMQRYASNVALNDSKFMGVRKAPDGNCFEACFTDVEVPIYPPTNRNVSSVSPPLPPDNNYNNSSNNNNDSILCKVKLEEGI